MSPFDHALPELTRYTATQLARRLADGQLSAAEVLEAHIQRIQQVDPQLNAVVVGLWEQARREACAADAVRARGQVLGPLHGVPVTIKELLDVAGTATTAGLTSRARHRAQNDAAVVACVRRAGAIVLGKTNSPQLGMMVESDNPVYGRTNNPWDLARARAAPPAAREPSSLPAGRRWESAVTAAGASVYRPTPAASTG